VGGPKINSESSWFLQTPFSGQILYWALVRVNAYKCAKFQLPSSISYWDKEGVPKFNVELLAPYRIPYAETFTCAQSTWQDQTACQISASYLYASCSYANMYFPWAFHYMCPKMRFLGFLRVKMWKYCLLIPKRHYPACIRVSWCIACQNRSISLSSRSVERFCVQRNKKNWVVTLAIWGKVTPGAILTKCRVWGDMVDVITCAIFGDCRLKGVGVVRGVSLPSPIDLTRRTYNTAWFQGHGVIFRPIALCAQLMHDLSAIAKFLPRDAMHKRGICRHAVSVCPSVCHVRELRQNE